MPDLFLIMGPNGAGKSTTAQTLLIDSVLFHNFLNADDMAREMGGNDMAAGRLLLNRAHELILTGENFSIETTGASKLAGVLATARAAGYRVHVVYIWLDSPELAKARVENRVKQGGHDIPPDVILRRYYNSLRNLYGYYLPSADSAVVYNNAGLKAELIYKKDSSGDNVYNEAVWSLMKGMNDGIK